MDTSETSLSVNLLVQLIRKMGHDIRAPLGSIMSTSEMFAEGYYDPLTPKQARANERIQRNSARVLMLLDDFVTYIKAEGQDIEPAPRTFEPNSSLTEWCAKVKSYAEQKNLKFHIVLSEQTPASLEGDTLIISRIVQALLWNAVAFTREGDIWLESDWTEQNEWIITVRDTGIGIPEADRPHLFEPFWRGQERPQVPTAGAGLGLAVSSALARLLKGELTLKETGTKGSTFFVRLPLKVAI